MVATWLAVVGRPIVSFFLFLWPRRGRNPATVWGDKEFLLSATYFIILALLAARMHDDAFSTSLARKGY